MKERSPSCQSVISVKSVWKFSLNCILCPYANNMPTWQLLMCVLCSQVVMCCWHFHVTTCAVKVTWRDIWVTSVTQWRMFRQRWMNMTTQCPTSLSTFVMVLNWRLYLMIFFIYEKHKICQCSYHFTVLYPEVVWAVIYFTISREGNETALCRADMRMIRWMCGVKLKKCYAILCGTETKLDVENIVTLQKHSCKSYRFCACWSSQFIVIFWERMRVVCCNASWGIEI